MILKSKSGLHFFLSLIKVFIIIIKCDNNFSVGAYGEGILL